MLPKTEVSKHPLFSLENLYQAYRKCRRHKRNTHNAMIFEQNLEENLVSLHEELDSGSYQPGRSLCFIVKKPKLREIFAADFRDRVVHHVLVGYLEPQWERRFIHDSYACRRGKGTHQGVDRLRSFTRQATANGSKVAWYLQLDVKGYFINLDRTILYQRLEAHEKDPTVLWLIRVILFTEVTENYRFRKASRQDFECLPEHKTLFKASPGCGLPIGNLTSQFFANVYLDALDQFVKHQLKARFYLRYCEEYFQWQKGKVVYRCPIPSRSMRFVSQKTWFKRYLPGHVLLIQQGGFWELDVESAALGGVTNNDALSAAKSWPRRFPDRRLRHLKPLLWDSGLLVGWVGETGRRLSNIAERTLICRWASTNSLTIFD